MVYAADRKSPFHEACHASLLHACEDPAPAFLAWNVCYEFMRVTTHARAPRSPWTSQEAWGFIKSLLESPGFDLLPATSRHEAVLAQTLEELPDVRGNLCHDLHAAVLTREHGISRIRTRDTDFHRFPFLTVVDPFR